MNKISVLLLKAFIGPFIVTLLIALLILEMQFLWLYIDDMMGKGIDIQIILQLLVYNSAQLVSMALPLAILMSSIMTMGALAENYELAALKSAGIGLIRIIRPLIGVITVIGIGAFFFANNVWPVANLKFRTLLYSITHQKPLLALDEGVFYTGIEGMSIRAENKNTLTGELTDLLIYDYNTSNTNRRVIRAEKGEMKKTHDGRYLLMTLYNGHMYDEQKEKKPKAYSRKKKKDKLNAHIHSTFEKDIVRFDLSSLQFQQTDEDLFSKSYQMMTINQILNEVDTMKIKSETREEDYINYFKKNSIFKTDSIINDKLKQSDYSEIVTKKNKNSKINKQTKKLHSDKNITKIAEDSSKFFWDQLDDKQKLRAISVASSKMSSSSRYIATVLADQIHSQRQITRYLIEYHRKFYLGFACLVLFFIGAPLGAIIRKGGLGLPAIFAIMFFAIYYILNMVGEKMVLSDKLEAWQGMWMSSVVLFPLGIWLTYKAANDAALMDKEAYGKAFVRIKKYFNKNDKKG